MVALIQRLARFRVCHLCSMHAWGEGSATRAACSQLQYYYRAAGVFCATTPAEPIHPSFRRTQHAWTHGHAAAHLCCSSARALTCSHGVSPHHPSLVIINVRQLLDACLDIPFALDCAGPVDTCRLEAERDLCPRVGGTSEEAGPPRTWHDGGHVSIAGDFLEALRTRNGHNILPVLHSAPRRPREACAMRVATSYICHTLTMAKKQRVPQSGPCTMSRTCPRQYHQNKAIHIYTGQPAPLPVSPVRLRSRRSSTGPCWAPCSRCGPCCQCTAAHFSTVVLSL